MVPDDGGGQANNFIPFVYIEKTTSGWYFVPEKRNEFNRNALNELNQWKSLRLNMV